MNTTAEKEMVDHPEHYNKHPSGVECIDVIEHMSLNVGNAVKYLWRADHKNNTIEDLKKAIWYINREISLIERSEKHYPTEMGVPVDKGLKSSSCAVTEYSLFHEKALSGLLGRLNSMAGKEKFKIEWNAGIPFLNYDGFNVSGISFTPEGSGYHAKIFSPVPGTIAEELQQKMEAEDV